MREIVHLQAGQCGNQIGSKVSVILVFIVLRLKPRVLIDVLKAGKFLSMRVVENARDRQ